MDNGRKYVEETHARRHHDLVRADPGDRRGRTGDGAADRQRPQDHLRHQLRLSRLRHQGRREAPRRDHPARRRAEDLEECRDLLGRQRRRHVSGGRRRRPCQQERQARLPGRLPDPAIDAVGQRLYARRAVRESEGNDDGGLERRMVGAAEGDRSDQRVRRRRHRRHRRAGRQPDHDRPGRRKARHLHHRQGRRYPRPRAESLADRRVLELGSDDGRGDQADQSRHLEGVQHARRSRRPATSCSIRSVPRCQQPPRPISSSSRTTSTPARNRSGKARSPSRTARSWSPAGQKLSMEQVETMDYLVKGITGATK